MNTFSIGEAVLFGWNAFKRNMGFFIPFAFIVVGVLVLSIYISMFMMNSGVPYEQQLLISLLVILTLSVLFIWAVRVALDAVDEKRLSFSSIMPTWEVAWKFSLMIIALTLLATPVVVAESISGWTLFGGLLGGSLSHALLGILGIVLSNLVFVYFCARFIFSPYYVVDQKLGPIESIKESWNVTRGIFWKVVGLMFVLTLINYAGTLAFVVGILVTTPIVFIASAYAYRSLTGSRNAVPTPSGDVVEPVPTPTVGQ